MKNSILIILSLAFVSMCFGQTVWQRQSPTHQLKFVAHDNEFMALGDSHAESSNDGINWVYCEPIPFSWGIAGLVCCANGYIVFGGDSGIYTRATITSDWIVRWHQKKRPLCTAVCASGKCVAIGREVLAISTNGNGTSWNLIDTNTTNNFKAICYGNGQFVAVGIGDSLYGNAPSQYAFGVTATSVDGITWTTQNTSIKNSILQSVVYYYKQFVAVGTRGSILTSPDAKTWTQQNSGTLIGLNSITAGNGKFVAVGYQGVILSSSDGMVWIPENSNTTGALMSIACSDGVFVAVGPSDILTSKFDITGVSQSNLNQSISGKCRINVNKKYVTVLLPEASGGLLTVELFNVVGKRIYSATHLAQNGILNLPISGLSTGAYLMSISGNHSEFIITK